MTHYVSSIPSKTYTEGRIKYVFFLDIFVLRAPLRIEDMHDSLPLDVYFTPYAH